ncbi:MAG: helix-turn-helix transcriptional regulator [Spirochaetes bacterium]|nr:helix-turn-helix transcriptional regulator [Spirochaetota bacterium]
MKVHIGEKIKERFEQSGLTVTSFSKKINRERSNVYDIFQRESIDTDLLQKICKILNHDFFQYYQEKKEDNTKKSDKPESANKTKILIELAFEEDMVLNRMLKEKVLQILK